MNGQGSTTIEAAPTGCGERRECGAQGDVTVLRDHLHCVGGGGDAVLDRTGLRVPRLPPVGLQADRVARGPMDRAPGTDRTGWLVDVHDARERRVSVRPFADAARKG